MEGRRWKMVEAKPFMANDKWSVNKKRLVAAFSLFVTPYARIVFLGWAFAVFVRFVLFEEPEADGSAFKAVFFT